MKEKNRVQPGNPHQLVIRQHIFPSASIARFTGGDGRTNIRLAQSKSEFRGKSTESIFYAIRAWDQRTENGLMKMLEDRFQKVADQIVNGSLLTVKEHMHEIVSDFFLLWQLRHHRRLNPISDAAASGLSPSILTRDEQEILEAKHTMYVTPEGNFPGRFISGILFFGALQHARRDMNGRRWGILRATDAEFIVPDNFGDYAMLPLSPTLMLAAGHADDHVSYPDVAKINTLAVGCSVKYYFAKDFDKTPVLRVPYLPVMGYALLMSNPRALISNCRAIACIRGPWSR